MNYTAHVIHTLRCPFSSALRTEYREDMHEGEAMYCLDRPWVIPAGSTKRGQYGETTSAAFLP